jgi:hypothetical protein
MVARPVSWRWNSYAALTGLRSYALVTPRPMRDWTTLPASMRTMVRRADDRLPLTALAES